MKIVGTVDGVPMLLALVKGGKMVSVALLALMGIGTTYQYVSTQLDNQRYPAPGELIDIGGYKLHINSSGQGKPVVILDSSIGDGSYNWDVVQKDVAMFARVCSYDRAGLGWSESSPRPRTSQAIVDELHTLLKNAHIDPPYILVGHSFGGINMRLYANTYPEDIFGVVLVDASHEKNAERQAALNQIFPQPKPTFFESILQYIQESATAMSIVSYTGIARLYLKATISNNGVILAKESTVKALLAANNEAQKFKESCKQLEDTCNTLEDKPLIVISAGKKQNNVHENRKEEVAARNQVWISCQLDLVSKSSQSKHIIAEKSGHMVNEDQPEIIVEAIRCMVAEYNRKNIGYPHASGQMTN